jgi:hypothetical protein
VRSADRPAHAFNQAALKFGHGPQDCENHPARWRRCIQRFRQADKLNPQDTERVERPQEMTDRAGEPVKLPDGHNVKRTLMCVMDESVQFWAAVFRAGDTCVNVLPSYSQSAPVVILAQFSGNAVSRKKFSREWLKACANNVVDQNRVMEQDSSQRLFDCNCQ